MTASPRSTAFSFLLACLGLACSSAPVIQPYSVGNLLPAVTLEDQFGKPHDLDDTVEIVLFSRDMESGELIRDLLAERGPQLLDEKRALYIADISGMPSLIARTMAIPRMRERSYPTLLDRDGQATGGFPFREGEATVLLVEKRKLQEIRRAPDAAALRAALE